MSLFDPIYIHVYKLFIIPHYAEFFSSLYVFVELKKCKNIKFPLKKNHISKSLGALFTILFFVYYTY